MSLGFLIGAAIAGKVLSEVVGSIHGANNDGASNAPGTAQIIKDAPSAKKHAEEQIRYCEYCEGIYYLGKDTVCPHCGAPITRNAAAEIKNGSAKADMKRVSGYYYTCYNCGSSIRYTEKDICRNPIANRAVRAQGFSDYSGEVKCPKCGAFLPHFEANWIQY